MEKLLVLLGPSQHVVGHFSKRDDEVLEQLVFVFGRKQWLASD